MSGRTEYKNNWQREHLDRINLTIPKGQKEVIKAHAEAHDESITAFIQRAIKETMERDDEHKDHIARLDDKHNVTIEDQDRLKKPVEAFTTSESIIPDIEKGDFSKLGQQPKQKRTRIAIMASPDSDKYSKQH